LPARTTRRRRGAIRSAAAMRQPGLKLTPGDLQDIDALMRRLERRPAEAGR
jgi:hypothetical protein